MAASSVRFRSFLTFLMINSAQQQELFCCFPCWTLIFTHNFLLSSFYILRNGDAPMEAHEIQLKTFVYYRFSASLAFVILNFSHE